MSKIAIISQPDEGVLIDVSGCSNLPEALEHLSSTLQVSSQFWQGLNVSINLGKLKLTAEDAAQVLAIAKGVGIELSSVYTKNSKTKEALIENGVNIGEGKPMSLPEINIDTSNIDAAEVEETGAKPEAKSTVAKIKLRVADALGRKKAAKQTEYKEVEKEKDIRETISNRIIQLASEAEGGITDDSASVSIAVTDSDRTDKSDASTDEASMTVAMTEEAGVVEETVSDINEEETSEKFETTIDADVDVEEAKDDVEEAEDVLFDQIAEEDIELSETQEPDEITCESKEADLVSEEDTDADANAEIDVEVEEEALEETVAEVVRPNAGGTMYLRQTLRSGQTVSHKGHLIIIGDVNPGAEVMAEGDITVWGSLRGIAHAGIGGNTEAEIRSLNLQPIQIRIAHAIARAPDKPRMNYSTSHGPETARIVAGKIRVFRSRLE